MATEHAALLRHLARSSILPTQMALHAWHVHPVTLPLEDQHCAQSESIS